MAGDGSLSRQRPMVWEGPVCACCVCCCNLSAGLEPSKPVRVRACGGMCEGKVWDRPRDCWCVLAYCLRKAHSKKGGTNDYAMHGHLRSQLGTQASM